MIFENYTLILKHEIVDGEKKIEVEKPLILKYTFDRRNVGSPIVINMMMDRLKEEIIKLTEDY